MFPPLNSYFTEKSHWVPLNNVLKVFVCLNINFAWLSEIRLFPFPAFYCGYVICCSRNIHNPALRAHFVYPPPLPPPLTVWNSLLGSHFSWKIFAFKRPLSPTPLNFQFPIDGYHINSMQHLLLQSKTMKTVTRLVYFHCSLLAKVQSVCGPLFRVQHW